MVTDQSAAIRKLVDEFAESVAKQNECIADGDPTTGNRYARKYISAFNRLRTFGKWPGLWDKGA